MDETKAYNLEDFDDKRIEKILIDVYDALEDRGYNPIKQLVGYLLSGDPGYISSHLEARRKISQVDRSKILEVLIRNYIEEKLWDI